MARRPVDEKIVKLSMDNSDLTMKATESASLLSKFTATLNKIPGVNLGKTSQELGNIGKATKNVPMDALSQSVSAVSDRFSTMGIIGMTVMQNLTNRAVDMGIKLAKSLTIDQIGEGFREYELKMGSIRTIMANTEHEGATLVDVKRSLEDLNKYADLTIYNFGQMTDSIGRFTAAGVGLEDSTIAIKGMSNLAATSGATTHQLNSAMYQMSQAMAAGRFNLMDWNSLVNSGMGGKITQDGLLKTAKDMGVAIDMSEGFRESLKDGWLTSEIFLKTMANFAEDESMIEAATKIRTFTQLIDTVQEAIGSGLGMTFEHIFGDFEEATELFSTVGEAMTGWIDKTMDKFNLFVGAIADGGGFLNVFKGFGNILKPVGQILGAVADGFGRAFKSVTPEVIVNATEKFLKFTESLKLSEGVVKVITSVFEYFFTGIRIGFTAIKNVADIVLPPLKTLGKHIASIFEGLNISIPPANELIQGFSKLLATMISSMGSWLGELLSNSAFSGLQRFGENIKSLTTIFEHHYEKTGSVFKALYNTVSEYLKYLNISFESFSDFVMSIIRTIGNVLKPVGDLVKGIFAELEFKHLLGGGFLVGVFGITKKIIENMDGLSGIWKGIIDFIDVMKNKSDNSTGFLTSISESLTNFSTSLKEGVTIGRIVAIAASIGILAVAMSQLSKLDTGQIASAMVAIASAMATLSTGIKALDGVKIDGIGSVQVVAFALAISILTKAMTNISELDASGMTKGVIALVTSMAVLVGAVRLMDNIKVGTGPVTLLAIAGTIKILVSTLDDIDEVRVKGLIKGLGTLGILMAELAIFARAMNYVRIPVSTAVSIAMIAGTMHILVSAIKKIDDIRVEGLIKGLGTIGILLAEIAIFAKVVKGTKLGPTQALGVLGISAAMIVMAKAIKDIDDIRVEGLIKGLGTIGILLAEIAVFAKVTNPGGLAASAAGLVLMSVAIRLMVPPIKDLGNTRWQDLVKGLGALAGALTIMTIASTAATAGIGGAAALTVMAIALNIIIIPIKALGQIKWTTLLSSLGKLALTLGIIAGASLLLSPAVLPILAFSGALIAFGAAVALIGGGLALFGVGLTALAGLTATTIAAVLASIEMLLDGAIGMVGKIGELVLMIVVTVAKVISSSVGPVVDAVVKVIFALLEAIRDNLGRFITIAADIIVALIEGLGENAPKLMDAGAETIIDLINGMTDTLNTRGPEFIEAMRRLVGAILVIVVDALVAIITTVFGWIPGFENLISGAGDKATEALRTHFDLETPTKEEVAKAEGVVDSNTGFVEKTAGMGKEARDEFTKEYLLEKHTEEEVEAIMKKLEEHKPGIVGGTVALGNGMTLGYENNLLLPSITTDVLGDIDKKILRSKGPYKQTSKDLGTGMSTGFDSGLLIDDYTGDVLGNVNKKLEESKDPMKKKGEDVGGSIDTGFKQTNFQSTGTYATQGIQVGLDNSSGEGSGLWKAAKNVGKSVLSSLKISMGIASPSKYTKESGVFLMEGLTIGMESMMGSVNKTAGNMGKLALDATNNALDAAMSEFDSEVRVKVLVDSTELDNLMNNELSSIRPNTRFTNRMVGESQPRNIQNEDRMYREPKETNEYNYDVHIHATGSLPRTTIRSMAEQFKEEIELIDRRSRINRGEEVVY